MPAPIYLQRIGNLGQSGNKPDMRELAAAIEKTTRVAGSIVGDVPHTLF
jgi:hypothetical protein